MCKTMVNETKLEKSKYYYTMMAVVFGADETLLNIELVNGFKFVKRSLMPLVDHLDTVFETDAMGLRRDYETAIVDKEHLGVICVEKKLLFEIDSQAANTIFHQNSVNDFASIDDQIRTIRFLNEGALRLKKIAFKMSSEKKTDHGVNMSSHYNAIIPISESYSSKPIALLHLDDDAILKTNFQIKNNLIPLSDTSLNICHAYYDLSYFNETYVYGLTATPTRQDGHHPIIFMQCGAIRYRVDAKEQAEKRSFEHYLVPRFTNTRYLREGKMSITDIYKKLSENELRNDTIVSDVTEALKNGRNPIVLTERRGHVALLAERLSCYCKNVIQLVGTASAKERRETLERLEAIPADESVVIVATGKYVGEGFDYPRLDTLFLALPIAWKGKVAQYAGRLHRNFEGKTEVQIYDYVDIHISVLERMYQKRMKSYSAIGYKTKLLSNANTTPDLIYDGKSFYHGFCNDLQNARSEILIVSPFMRKSRITGLMKTLTPVIESGVCVTVVIRPPEDFKERDRNTVAECAEKLRENGVTVKYKSDFHQKFTVIDQSIIWYGSVNFLSFGTHEESIMRFENTDIAGQLMDTVL